MEVYIVAILCVLLGLIIGFLIGTNIYSPMRSRITAETISRMRDAMKSLCYEDEDVFVIIKRMGCKIMPPGIPMPGHVDNGALQITIERRRQIVVEGYDKAHDHLESVDALSMAAASYAIVDMDEQQSKAWWPWQSVHYKPKDRLRNLVRAGALIAAAIDRLQEKQ